MELVFKQDLPYRVRNNHISTFKPQDLILGFVIFIINTV